MADPLLSSASQLAPSVEPKTSFFDQGLATNIMQRYALSSENRAFAEETVKSAAAIDDMRYRQAQQARQSVVWDREDEDYKTKKEYEDLRGQVLVDVAGLDENAEDFDVKVAGLLKSNPMLGEDTAVKSILASKENKRSQMLAQRERDATRMSAIAETVGQWGGKMEDILTPEGTIDYTKFAAIGAKRTQELTDLERSKIQYTRGVDAEDRMDTDMGNLYGKDDWQALKSLTPSGLDRAASDRAAAVLTAAEKQGVQLDPAAIEAATKNVLTTSKDAFVASILPASGSSEPSDGFLSPSAAAERDKRKAVVKSVGDLWNVLHRRASTVPTNAVPPQAGQPASAGAPPKPAAQPNQNAEDYIQSKLR